jgi:hypothetical protein
VPFVEKNRDYGIGIGLAAVKFGENAPGTVGLRVNLHGDGALSSAMLADDQDRTVAVGDSSNSTLNLRLDRCKVAWGGQTAWFASSRFGWFLYLT